MSICQSPPDAGGSDRFKTKDKFDDPVYTANGELRAVVPFSGLKTLWINTGTLCNLSCANCYIESTPLNDRLVYMPRSEAYRFMEEAAAHISATEIGFTGGEPFMNPEFLGILDDALSFGFHVLILTNAMRPLQRLQNEFSDILQQYKDRISIRVSLDHYQPEMHDKVRGAGSWDTTLKGLHWLREQGAELSVAGRLMWHEDETAMRQGYASVFARENIPVDSNDPASLVLFPEMDEHVDVPEITEKCWSILGKTPESVMCASARMVVMRKNEAKAKVLACTLIPYDTRFELGETLESSFRPVALNHRHCAKFCVLGGASCSQ